MKKIIVAIIAVLLIIPVLSIPSFADSASISVSAANVAIGNKVTVNVSYSSTMGLYAVSGKLSFNSSVLKYVSGGTSASGSTVSFYKDLNGESSASFSVSFESIATGTSSMNLHMEGSDGSSKGSADASKSITVSPPAPSSNANLASLKIDGASLTPEFSPKVTTYSASVANDVEAVSIKATPADSGANVMGTGDKQLKEGDNSFVITVSAPSGAKKSYTLNIRRRLPGELTEEEILTTAIDGAEKKIVKDILALPVYPGFTQTTTLFKDVEIGVLADSLGKYTLFYLTDPSGENPKLCIKNENDEFSYLPCLENAGKLYILETEKKEELIPKDYKEKKFELNGKKYSVYGIKDSSMKDFYVLYLFDGENEGYYLYDNVNATLQRYPLFESLIKKEIKAKNEANKKNFFERRTKLELALIIALFLAIISVGVLVVLYVIKRNKTSDRDFFKDYKNGFNIDISNDFDD